MRPLPEIDGWRTIAPVDCIGAPAISAGYINDLIELAGPDVRPGDTVSATFTQVDGVWIPIKETLSITH